MNRGSAVLTRPDARYGSGFNEAPIHESGKSASHFAHFRSVMRFNEAPIHESGKYYADRAARQRRVYRFNEAPIHESGKSGCAARIVQPDTGFNEAPIHESGKCASPRTLFGEMRPASMRPRFMNRGSIPCIDLAALRMMLLQ